MQPLSAVSDTLKLVLTSSFYSNTVALVLDLGSRGGTIEDFERRQGFETSQI